MTLYSLLLIPLGYLIGAIPSAYIIARCRGIDIRSEGDGKISAAAVYRRLKLLPFLLTVFMDIGKGLLAIYITRLATDSVPLWFIVGIAVVIGHSWSVFLKFKGGLGATVMAGVLCGLIFWPWFVTGIAFGIVVLAVTRKSGLSSAVILLVISLFLFIHPENYTCIAGFYPLLFGALMLLKRYQKKRASIK